MVLWCPLGAIAPSLAFSPIAIAAHEWDFQRPAWRLGDAMCGATPGVALTKDRWFPVFHSFDEFSNHLASKWLLSVCLKKQIIQPWALQWWGLYVPDLLSTSKEVGQKNAAESGSLSQSSEEIPKKGRLVNTAPLVLLLRCHTFI